MATRDLTVTYLRLRSALHMKSRGRDDQTGGLLGSEDGSYVIPGASPVYVEMVTDAQNDITGIDTKMEELGKLHDERLRIGFDPAAEQEKEHEIEILTSEVTRTFNRAAGKLKRIVRQSENANDATESKVLKNIQRSLASRLHEQSTAFRQMQKTYLGQIKRMREGASFGSILGGGSGGGGSGNDRDLGFTDEQMHELAVAEEDVDERMREIQRIAKSVEDLAVLFKELATLVVDQGTILDRIDYNMEQTVVHAKEGVKQLVEAEKYQKSARPIKCMAILMVLIVVMVIIIAIRKTQ